MPPHPYHSPTRRGFRAAWPWLLLAGALGLWVVEAVRGGSDALPPGELAPAIELPTAEGSFSLDQARGRVVVMAFWATWCEACRAEGPILSRLQDRIAPDGDRVVGVSVDELSPADIQSAADRLGMSYLVAKATPAAVAGYAVDVLPTIYVIGPDGRIAESFTGMAGESALLEAVERARDRRVSVAP